jgi:hypothetical protein
MASEFLHDVRALKRRARDCVEGRAAAQGAVRYLDVVLHLLNGSTPTPGPTEPWLDADLPLGEEAQEAVQRPVQQHVHHEGDDVGEHDPHRAHRRVVHQPVEGTEG